MPRYREVVIKIPAAVQVDVPFATVEASHSGVRIVTMDDEWLSQDQLLEIAQRRRKQLALSRRRRRLDIENS